MRSIEFAFLQRRDKRLPLPNLVFAPVEWGGYYCRPEESEREVEGNLYDCRSGIIVVSTLFDQAGSTLAHEWRHHWQFHNGLLPERNLGWNFDGEYEATLRDYFASQWHERDALRFEMASYKADYQDEWRSILEDVVSGLI